jgi:hypothetical protein
MTAVRRDAAALKHLGEADLLQPRKIQLNRKLFVL